MLEELKVFSGTANPILAQQVCNYLKLPLGAAHIFKFSNDNTFVQYQENIRQQDVFLIQPFAFPVNDSIMELLIMVDAAKRASAGRITIVVPYFSYGRTDKKDQPRVPITARLIADLVTVAGADRLLTIDLHAGQIQGFFNIPVDELSALPLLSNYFLEKQLSNPVVVAVDIGISKRARDMAERIGASLAIIEKRRIGNGQQAESLNVIGDVFGKTAITFDDETDTAGSLSSAVKAIRVAGATEIFSCCTHGVFSGSGVNRVAETGVQEFIVTDTLPQEEALTNPSMKVLSVASLLGEAIRRIHSGLSVGEMFK